MENINGIMITGASDDLIEVDGEISEEFNSFDCKNAKLALSDGTLLNVDYDNEGIWRFIIVCKGTLFDKKIDGDFIKDTNDEVYFKSGIKWVLFTDSYGFAKRK